MLRLIDPVVQQTAKRKLNITAGAVGGGEQGVVDAFEKHWKAVSIKLGDGAAAASTTQQAPPLWRRSSTRSSWQSDASTATAPVSVAAVGVGDESRGRESPKKPPPLPPTPMPALNSSLVMNKEWWTLWRTGLVPLMPTTFGVRAVKAYECEALDECIGVVMNGIAGDCVCYHKP